MKRHVRHRAQSGLCDLRTAKPIGTYGMSIAAAIAIFVGASFGVGATADAASPAADAPPPMQLAAGSADFEAELWNFIKDGDNPEDIDAFLAIFPNGKYAGMAKEKLAGLRGGSATMKAPEPKKKSLPSLNIAPIKVTAMQARRAARTRARVRARPDTSSATIAIISQGQLLDVTGKVEKSDWVRAELPGGRRGYIYGPLLGPVPVAKVAPTRQPAAPPVASVAAKPAEPAVAAAPAAAPPVNVEALAARRTEVAAQWDQKIALIKRTGQHTECYSAGGNVDTDSTEYMDCTDREATIARLEAAKRDELAEIDKTSGAR